MPRFFRFRNVAEAFNVTEAIDASPTLARARDRLVARHGPRGQEIIEDMLAVVMRHAGDHYVAVRGAQIDRVLELRQALEHSYSRLMRFGDDAPSRADTDTALADIARRYAELDAALENATRPLEPFVLPPATRDALAQRYAALFRDPDGRPVRGFAEQPTQAGGRAHAADFADARGRLPGEQGYRASESRAFRKDWREDPSDPGVWRRSFEDGSTAELRLRDGRYELISTQSDGTSVTIREGAVNVDPYARKIRTTSLMNAHHGIQAHPMRERFGDFGYDPDAAPTIWLRNSRAGSPHGRITAVEGRTGLHPTEPGSRLTDAGLATVTYADMRRTAVREMLTSGIAEADIRAFLAAHDRYFADRILPNIPAAQRPGLLGDWSPDLPGAMP